MDEKIQKLKANINQDVISKFDVTQLVECQFLPINIKNTTLFAVGNQQTRKQDAGELVKSICGCDTQFIFLPNEAYKELFSSINIDQKSHTISTQNEPINQPSSTSQQIQQNTPITSGQSSLSDSQQEKQIPKTFAEMNKMIGDVFLESGEITETQMAEAMEDSKRRQEPIGSILYSMGCISLPRLKIVLAEIFQQEVVSDEMFKDQSKFIKILPEDFIKENKILPIYSDGKVLQVGLVEPYNTTALKEIVYITGQNPKPLVVTSYEFERSIDKFFSQEKKKSDKILQKLEEEASQLRIEDTLWEQIDKELQESSSTVAEFVNKILTDAIDLKASDIHIEPRLKNHVVRYRIDGILRHALDLPAKIEQTVLTRFKVLSRMNIAEHRRPQDGTFTINYKERAFDFRINTLPVSGKEKMVIRVLAPAVTLNSSEKEIKLLGATTQDLVKIKKLISAPNGIILTSGPTGSGKTTTLYSILKNLNTEGVNITTIEDPIEIKIEGINQSQVNVKAGITFASCMRAILRQDPDIILVGEIRDYETLEVAISAALTGHLVLSTVHTNSAASTLTRLIEMGAKDYLVSSTLIGVISQRLVRHLCKDCREEYFPSHDEAAQIFNDEEDIHKLMNTKIYRAKGCGQCDMTGYKGRMGVYEILPISKELRKLISQGAHDIEIEEAAIATGMKTLTQACLNHLLNGDTTIEEYVRVLGLSNE